MNERLDLAGKHIVLGLSGGIACYKAAELTRALGKAGATVQVVMTAGGAVDLAASQAVGGNGGEVVETVVKDEHENIGRNDPCWCGSGKKFKKCHGS